MSWLWILSGHAESWTLFYPVSIIGAFWLDGHRSRCQQKRNSHHPLFLCLWLYVTLRCCKKISTSHIHFFLCCLNFFTFWYLRLKRKVSLLEIRMWSYFVLSFPYAIQYCSQVDLPQLCLVSLKIICTKPAFYSWK